MQDDEGAIVDMYIPRKCSATNRLINAKDHASVQIEIAGVSISINHTEKLLFMTNKELSNNELPACFWYSI